MQPSAATCRVAVKDHVMIAHSLSGEVFGPARRLHGATYEVITEYATDKLDDNGIVVDNGVVVDIGLATDELRQVLDPLRFTNLDDLPWFEGHNTTTEFPAKWVHGQIAAAFAGRFRGRLRVTLEETWSRRTSTAGCCRPMPATPTCTRRSPTCCSIRRDSPQHAGARCGQHSRIGTRSRTVSSRHATR